LDRRRTFRFNAMKNTMRKITVLGVLAGMIAITGCYYYGPCLNGSGPVITEQREITGYTGVTNTGSFNVYVSEADNFSVAVVAQENLLPMIETYVSGSNLIIETKNDGCYRTSSPVEVYVSLPALDLLRLTGSGKVFADVAASPEVEITNSGSGSMEIDTVYAEAFVLGNSGSGYISVEGVYADEADMVQSGSGSIIGGWFFGTADLGIRHSSSGQVVATVLDGTLVDAILSGSGKIELSGAATVAEYILNSSGRMDALNLEVQDVDATNTGSGKLFLWATDFLDATITGSGDIIYRGAPGISETITGSGSLRPY
jgi:hypothetical protein